MSRGLVCSFMIFLLSFQLHAQGWRAHEMEVVVNTATPADRQKLGALSLPFEPASSDGSLVRMYLVPKELEQLKDSGIEYRVRIPDLNAHYAGFWDNPLVPPGYYNYEQIVFIIDSLATHFPSICKKVMLGTSVGNRQLAALKISDNVNEDEPEPEILFDGGIHGDEVGGAQNMIMFARELCLVYDNDPTLTDLVNTREIWLYPMVNPDGRVSMSRYNNNGVDINRDNGYMWDGEGFSPGACSQVETKTLRNLLLDNQFVVYTNYHSGTEIISYPWSYRASSPRDIQHIDQLAQEYANHSGYGNLTYGQGYLVMYAINGSTKDFQYGSLGNVGWSIEISNDKQPPSSQISFFYNANKSAMLEVIKECGWGISGIVTDSISGEPVRANLWVNNLYPVSTDPVVGDYHKYLVPGTYSITVKANGYQTKTVNGINVPSQGSAVTDIALAPEPGFHAWRLTSCRIPGNNFGDEGFTPGCLGKPDSVPYSIGRTGWAVVDMGDTIYNKAGNDFKVVQNGITKKSFTVSGGIQIDGPFTTIGSGTGTLAFDLGSASVNKVRYLQIKDNGTGSATGPGAGYNFDGVEMLSLPLVVRFHAGNPSPCTGAGVDFIDASYGNPTSWSWSFPGGNPSASIQQNPTGIVYDTPGTYDVTLTASDGFTTVTRTMHDYVNVLESPVVSLGNDTTVCMWNSIVLDAGNPGGSYLWSTGDTTQTLTVDSTGTGLGSRDIWVHVVFPPGCSTYDTLTVTFDECTGMAGRSGQETLSVYPNPSTGSFSFDIQDFKKTSWEVLTAAGIPVIQGNLTGPASAVHIPVPGKAAGIYLLKINADGNTLIRKVIITP